MLILRLLVLNLGHLFDQLLPLSLQLLHLLLMLCLLALHFILKISYLFRRLLVFLLCPAELRVSVLALLLDPLGLLPEVVAHLDVLDPLLEHIKHRVDGLLDVLRPAFEEVTDGWHAVLLLSFSDVVGFILKLGDDEALVIVLL